MTEDSNNGKQQITAEELKAAIHDMTGGAPRVSIVINGKHLRELTDQELAAAIIYFKVTQESVDREFSEAHQKHMNWHGARSATLYEYDRRRHAETRLVGPGGRPI
jgi:hypothetical protein